MLISWEAATSHNGNFDKETKFKRPQIVWNWNAIRLVQVDFDRNTNETRLTDMKYSLSLNLNEQLKLRIQKMHNLNEDCQRFEDVPSECY